ncbi:MAG: transglutaminase domain-containing protein, partial [bacterium]
RIRVRVPDFSESGLLVVHTDRRESSGLLVRNRDDIPRQPSSDRVDRPEFDDLSSDTLTVGDVLVIEGRFLGNARHRRPVVFTGAAGVPVPVDNDEVELWTDREIRVRVPDGAASGPVSVEFIDGRRVPGDVAIRTPGVTRRYGEPVSFAVELFARLSTGAEQLPAGLWLWWPSPRPRQMQGSFEVVSSYSPDELARERDMLLFEWRNTAASRLGVRQTILASRTSVEFEFNPSQVRREYNRASPIYERYTAEDPQYGMTTERVTATARNVFSSNDPLTSARRAFNTVVESLSFDIDGPAGVDAALEQGQGNSQAIARYMVGLLRLSRVPARVVHGVRMTEAGELPFYSWVEFLIPGAGWAPADPAAEAGADEHFFDSPEDPQTGIISGFGRIDSRRLELSAGAQTAVRLLPSSRTVRHPVGLTQSDFHAEWSSTDTEVDLSVAPVTLLEMPPVFRASPPDRED